MNVFLSIDNLTYMGHYKNFFVSLEDKYSEDDLNLFFQSIVLQHQIQINQSSKQFFKSSFVRLSMACSKAVSISLSSLNRTARNCFFIFRNKKKSQGLQSGEYAAFSYCSTWFSSKNSLGVRARCGFALSS